MSLLLSSASVAAEFFSQRRRRGESERGAREGSAMASCSLGGASNIKHFCFPSKVHKAGNIGLVSPYKITCSRLESPYGFGGIQKKHEPSYAPVFSTKHYNLTNPLVVRCASSSAKNGLDAITEEERSTRELTTPGSSEVKALLITICDTTSIAEVELNIAGLRLYVKRSLVEKNVPPPAPILPATQTSTSNHTPESNGSASTASLAIYKPQSSYSMQRILDTSASDEGLVIIQSPRVGFFRRSRTIKGKRAPPPCKEKQLVKEGQVICYVEQLGGEIPIESDVSGEVVKILRYDGEPIGYGDALISILPSFPGIKKLQ